MNTIKQDDMTNWTKERQLQTKSSEQVFYVVQCEPGLDKETQPFQRPGKSIRGSRINKNRSPMVERTLVYLSN